MAQPFSLVLERLCLDHELVSGLILKTIGIQAWEYTGPTSVLGVIRLDYAPLWFMVGLIFERIHNLLLSYHVGIK